MVREAVAVGRVAAGAEGWVGQLRQVLSGHVFVLPVDTRSPMSGVCHAPRESVRSVMQR